MNRAGRKRGKVISSAMHALFVALLLVFFIAVPMSNAANITNTTNLTLSLPAEVLPGYIEILPDDNITTNETYVNDTEEVGIVAGPLIGEIVSEEDNESNTTSYYVRLDDPVVPTELTIDFAIPKQQQITGSQAVTFTQAFTLESSADEDEFIVNLWEFADGDTLALMKVAQDIEIVEQTQAPLSGGINRVISQELASQPIFSTTLSEGEVRDFVITYTTAPVESTQNCADFYLFEYLPEGVTIIENDLPLSTLLGTKCDVTISKDNSLVYSDVTVVLDQLPYGDESVLTTTADDIIVDGSTLRISDTAKENNEDTDGSVDNNASDNKDVDTGSLGVDDE